MRRRSLIAAGSAALWLPANAFPASSAAPPAVLELFTSQGCSSCPPADALLGELAQQPQLIALAWHVDYWNSQSWRDPYASAEWTRRQRRYAQLLDDIVYTPAMIINGTHMVVGSDRAAVQAALAKPYRYSIETSLDRSPKGLMAHIGPIPAAASVSLIVFDAAHATSVRGGENAGRSLHEARVVRSATALDVGSGGTALSLPDLPPGQGAVLLVQGPDFAILGAAQVRPASADLL